jgi:hypothetical protein
MSTEVSEKLFPDGEFLPDTFRVQMNGYAVKMIPTDIDESVLRGELSDITCPRR